MRFKFSNNIIYIYDNYSIAYVIIHTYVYSICEKINKFTKFE